MRISASGSSSSSIVSAIRKAESAADAIREIRRIKARVDSERLPRGADPATHTKLGRGGLADVEWTVQLLQLKHAHEFASLHCTSTLETLAAAAEAGLLSQVDADQLSDAWLTATAARNALVLVKGKPTDQLPGGGRVLAAVARAAGWPGDAVRSSTTICASRGADGLSWSESSGVRATASTDC